MRKPRKRWPRDRARYRCQLMKLLRQLNRTVRLGVEVGVHRGDLSAFLLYRFESLTLLLVDNWEVYPVRTSDSMSSFTEEDQQANFELAVQKTEPYGARAVIYQSDSVLAASRLLKEYGRNSLDFVFIDANHTYEGQQANLAAYWPLVRRGGLFSGHDYACRNFPGVVRAVNEFAAEQQLPCYNGAGHVWWMYKP